MERNYHIDVLKIVAAFAVVVLHVSAGVRATATSSLDWWFAELTYSATHWCVPVFVMASGATLIGERTNAMTINNFYKRRLNRLLAPTIFWSLAFIFWSHIFHNSPPVDWSIREKLTFAANSIIKGSPYYHLWYLYMIIGMYLFVPYISRLLISISRNELIYLTFLILGISLIENIFEYFNGRNNIIFLAWFIDYIGYFLLGYVIKIIDIRISYKKLLCFFAIIAITTVLGSKFLSVFNSSNPSNYFNGYLSITVIPMSIIVYITILQIPINFVNNNYTSYVSSATLFIYLAHPIPIDLLRFLNDAQFLMRGLIFIPLSSIILFISLIPLYHTFSRIKYLRDIC